MLMPTAAAVHAATLIAGATDMTTAVNMTIRTTTATAEAMDAAADLGGGQPINTNMDTKETMTLPTNTRGHALMSTPTATNPKTCVTAELLAW